MSGGDQDYRETQRAGARRGLRRGPGGVGRGRGCAGAGVHNLKQGGERRPPEKTASEIRPEQGRNELSTLCRKTPRKTEEVVQRAWGGRVLTS